MSIGETGFGSTGRRDFLLGGGAFLAAAGASRGVFAGAGGSPRLRIGVVSDLHIDAKPNTCVLWEKALAFFRDRNVDAVIVSGDIADCGLVSELKKAGDAWRKIFPGNKRPDGGHVEKVFVTGNHDVDGWKFMKAAANAPESDILSHRIAEAWREAFDEEYSPMYLKTVKGYSFVGTHYVNGGGFFKKGEIESFLEKNRSALEGAKPFFYVQHYHPQGTCSAPWVWGQDAGYSTSALSKFPNAVAFSGHSHTPLTDDRTLWRGRFTSIGAASMRYIQPFGGRENSFITGEPALGNQQMPAMRAIDGNHGQLATVYDDRIVIERIDFRNSLPLAQVWIVPLPAKAETFEERGQKAKIPEFPKGSAVKIKRVKGFDRAKRPTDQIVVSFPNVRSSPKGVHAFDFRIMVEAEEADCSKIWGTKRVFSPHFYWAPEKDNNTVTCVFAEHELPPPSKLTPRRGRKFRFAVSPANCYGGHGAAIRSDWTWNKFKDSKSAKPADKKPPKGK